jgi:hypothetical protein
LVLPGDDDPDAAVKPLAEGPLHEAFLSPAKNEDPQHVDKTPPQPITERPGVDSPDPKAQWIEGYWDWDPSRNDFSWVTGTWRVPPPGRFWVNGYWKRDDDGWFRVPGFWSDRQTDRIDYKKDGPPKDHPDDDPGPSPGEDFFYIPGQYVPDADGVVWKKGFWAKAQPGWAWVPAQWVKQPEGYVFQEGYWDRVLEDRGILFSPAAVTNGVGGTLTYSPIAQIAPQSYGRLYGALGRPTTFYDGYPGCYYDSSGLYYGYANYGNIGMYTGYLDYPYVGGLGGYPYLTTGGYGGLGYGGFGYGGLGYGGLGYGGFGYGGGLGLISRLLLGYGGLGYGGLGYGGFGYGGLGYGGLGYGGLGYSGFGLPFLGGFGLGYPFLGGLGYGRGGGGNHHNNNNYRHHHPFYPGNHQGQQPGRHGGAKNNGFGLVRNGPASGDGVGNGAGQHAHRPGMNHLAGSNGGVQPAGPRPRAGGGANLGHHRLTPPASRSAFGNPLVNAHHAAQGRSAGSLIQRGVGSSNGGHNAHIQHVVARPAFNAGAAGITNHLNSRSLGVSGLSSVNRPRLQLQPQHQAAQLGAANRLGQQQRQAGQMPQRQAGQLGARNPAGPPQHRAGQLAGANALGLQQHRSAQLGGTNGVAFSQHQARQLAGANAAAIPQHRLVQPGGGLQHQPGTRGLGGLQGTNALNRAGTLNQLRGMNQNLGGINRAPQAAIGGMSQPRHIGGGGSLGSGFGSMGNLSPGSIGRLNGGHMGGVNAGQFGGGRMGGGFAGGMRHAGGGGGGHMGGGMGRAGGGHMGGGGFGGGMGHAGGGGHHGGHR